MARYQKSVFAIPNDVVANVGVIVAAGLVRLLGSNSPRRTHCSYSGSR